MNVISDWHLSLGVDDILRGQGVDPEIVRNSKPRFVAAAKRALVEGISLLHPVAVVNKVKVLEHKHERILLDFNMKLTGPLVTRHLSGAQCVVASACTIGPELEKSVSQFLGEDPLQALALDGLANAAVEILAQQVCAFIGEQSRADGQQASTPLSPGNPEWPFEEGQLQIFALLNPSQAGITLTSGGMMLPKKSISFIVGLGPEMSQAGMCEVCSLKETCRYQHA
jgi:hypothetical protein